MSSFRVCFWPLSVDIARTCGPNALPLRPSRVGWSEGGGGRGNARPSSNYAV